MLKRRLPYLQGILFSLFISVFPLGASADGAKPFLVGFSQDTLANDWRATQVRALQQAFEAIPGIQFIYSDGKGSTAKQISDIEDMLRMGVNVLITSPRDSRAMSPVISRAYRSGTPVILLTRRIEGEDYTSFIAPDDAAIARDAAHYLSRRLGPKGAILILQGVSSASTAITRTNVFIETLDHSKEAPSVVAIKEANYLRSDAVTAVEESIRSGLKFNAIYAQSDSMASGARLALAKAGYRPGEVVLVGIDYIAEAREAIRRGEQDASFTYPTCAREAADLVRALRDGKSIPKHVLVPSQMVTRDNVEQIDAIF